MCFGFCYINGKNNATSSLSVDQFNLGGSMMNNSNIPKTTSNLILAVDGSDHAFAAINLVQNLPLPESCRITVLSVLIPRNAQYHATLEHFLEQTGVRLRSVGYNVETRLLSGYPAEQIINYTNKHSPDLVVLGAKGLRGTPRILLGGVAQQVIEYATCPVLIVRTPHTNNKRILLVTDGSEHSRFAIQHLDLCPLPSEAEITVLHVLPPKVTTEMLIRSWPYGMDVIPVTSAVDIEENLAIQAEDEERMGEQIVQETVNNLTDLGITASTVLRRGDAATEILNYAQEHQIDLIIAGSRGLTQIQSWFLGSVSRKLVHYADCSVLIVKQNKDQIS
jgi:nucleotide-binding universal stress UspA family protein